MVKTEPFQGKTVETRVFLDCPVQQRRESTEVRGACEVLAGVMEEVGLACIQPPSPSDDLEDRYLEMVVKYFGQDEEALACDERPDLQWQVGRTPPYAEKARRYPELGVFLDAMDPEVRPEMADGREDRKDPKQRFFAPFGPKPPKTKFPLLNAPPVLPAAFPEWDDLTTRWGNHLLEVGIGIMEMLEVAYDIPNGDLASLLEYGPHLVAPTGVDLAKLEPGDVVAWGHLDLNNGSLHGRSNLPGLVAWTRAGKAVTVPLKTGQLLFQAAMQLERVLNGRIRAGLHAVYAWPTLADQMAAARAAGKKLIRSTSTVFLHAGTDQMLVPHPRLVTQDTPARFAPILAGHQVARELDLIFGTVEELTA